MLKKKNQKSVYKMRKFSLRPIEEKEKEEPMVKTVQKSNKYEVRDYPVETLIPQKISSSSTEIPITSLMKEDIIPSHPFSALFVGKSGSGKTNCLIYMINNFYRKYFERIVVIGQTVKSDGMYENFDEDIKEEDIISDNLVSECSRILDERQSEVEEKGVVNCPRMLVILEDATSERKLMASQSFMKLFVQLRHLGSSIICCAHKLRGIPRVCRLNAVGLFVFTLDRSDEKILIDEYCPRILKKNEFADMLKYIWTRTKDFPRPFLYYNRTLDEPIAYRKGFSEIMEIGNE